MKKIYFLLTGTLFLLLSTNVFAQFSDTNCDSLTVAVTIESSTYNLLGHCRNNQAYYNVTVTWWLTDMTIITQQQRWQSGTTMTLYFTIPYSKEDVVNMKVAFHEGSLPGDGCTLIQGFEGYVSKVIFRE